MRDKIAGTLYGMALGDAMGMPSELWGRKRIKNFFNEITEFLDGPDENEIAFNYDKGQITDDTGQALVILDSLTTTNFVPDPKDIATRMLKWADDENAFENNMLGPTSKVALANFRKGIVDSTFTDKSLSNGSAMRIAPIGCLFDLHDKQKIVDFVYDVSKVTHSSDVTIAGAAMIAVAVSSAMVNSDFDKIMEDVKEIEVLGYNKGCETFSARLNERLNIGLELAKQYQGDDEMFSQKLYDVVGSGVGIIESVPAALAVAYYAKDPNKASLICANLGGDTDTIGAMSAAICGAYTGVDGINSNYINTLKAQNDIDFDYYINILEEGRSKLL